MQRLGDSGKSKTRAAEVRQKKTERGRWRAWPSALVENGCGCFVPDLTRLTIPPCEEARHETFYHRSGRRATVNTNKPTSARW